MAVPKGHKFGERKGVWTSALKRAISRQGEGNWRQGLDKLADKMIAAANKGDQWALNHVADRLEGKAAETVHIEQTLHLDEISSRTLAGTLRPLADKADTPQPTVQ